MKSCVNISLAILLAVLVSFAGAETFAKGNESLKTAPEATTVKRPATPLAVPQKADPTLLTSELKRLLIRGEANFILATSSDIKTLSDVTRCPNCTKILAGLEASVRKGELPKEALAVAAIDPNNPILLAAVNQANPQLGDEMIQLPTVAKPGVSGATLPGSFSMGIQVGVDGQTGLPKVTGIQTGQGDSGREALRAGFGLDYLRLTNGGPLLRKRVPVGPLSRELAIPSCIATKAEEKTPEVSSPPAPTVMG